MSKCLLEVCAADIDSVIAARDAGAARVELCSALSEGGVTPSAGFLQTAVALRGEMKINVLIRPRGGDFLYSEEEAAIMEADVRIAVSAGVDGIVIGALNADGSIDTTLCQRLIKAAGKGVGITFHRAFDMCNDPFKALEEIIALGCDRLLTSGQAASAQKGIPMLRELQKRAAGAISIMPGCGVNPSNAAEIVAATGVREIHASASEQKKSMMRFRQKSVAMGNPETDEYARITSSRSKIEAILKAITTPYNTTSI